MRLALFEPDIPGNTGAVLRLGACLGIGVDLIEPAGFVLDDKRLRRAGMDYLDAAELVRHPNWAAFERQARESGRRLVLLTTSAELSYTGFNFQTSDILLLGRESAGVPPEVHQSADARIRIPMAGNARSLNVAVAAAMVIGEALRQTDLLPADGE